MVIGTTVVPFSVLTSLISTPDARRPVTVTVCVVSPPALDTTCTFPVPVTLMSWKTGASLVAMAPPDVPLSDSGMLAEA